MTPYKPSKRLAAGGAAIALAIAAAALFMMPGSEGPTIVVYKSPTCGCCAQWVDHLRADGFTVSTEDVTDLAAVKSSRGVPPELSACHTAIVDGYVVEGHVPADVIRRLLEERPNVVGITVPGMPIGSPGMEVEGRPGQPYEVLSFDEDGRTEVYARR